MSHLPVPAALPAPSATPAAEPGRRPGADRSDRDRRFADLVRGAEAAASRTEDERRTETASDDADTPTEPRPPDPAPDDPAPDGSAPADRASEDPGPGDRALEPGDIHVDGWTGPGEALPPAPHVDGRETPDPSGGPPSSEPAPPPPPRSPDTADAATAVATLDLAEPDPAPVATGPGVTASKSPEGSPSLPADPADTPGPQVAAMLPSAAPRGGSGSTVDSLDAVPPVSTSGAAAAGPLTEGSSPAPAGAGGGHGPEAGPVDEPWQQVARALAPARPTVDGTHRMTLRLHPRALGFVHVDVTLRDGDMQVRLLTQTDAARDAMLGSVDQLRRELATTGTPSTSVDIQSRSDHQLAGGATRHPGSDGRAGSGDREPPSPDPDASTPEPSGPFPELRSPAASSAGGLVVDL